MAEYANIIVDISHEKLDKTFQYRVPQQLKQTIREGMQVSIPFGARKIKGFVVELTDEPAYEVDKIKDIYEVVKNGVSIESQMIALAAWMRKNYGGTMNQALKTVLPARVKTKELEKKIVRLALHPLEAKNQLAEYERKHSVARARLLTALLEQGELEWNVITQKLNVTTAVIRAMEEAGIVKVLRTTTYRNPVGHLTQDGYDKILNEEQQHAVDQIVSDYENNIRKTYLIKGVTGSGKTEVYMELISHVIKHGKQAIVLIPEIALTYQTVMRFYHRFGDQVSILNSKLSQGERYDQSLRAQNGEIDIMIGPRSALFTPFPDLGLIIIDEEHETSYKSETVPKYHARETAIERARMSGASVVLGSATPSVDSYYYAKQGRYELIELKKRVMEKPLPACEIVDLREELRRGNRSILSDSLSEKMEERLKNGQQTILFINRRGIAGFVSCRACGHVIKCPHCDVSLSQHANGSLLCHYCGHKEPMPKACPVCGSRYIGGFKAGTQKIEQVVKERFPSARVLRMDFDTTRSKEGHEKILSAFANQEADILVGTQMIVKGHDFPNVTLVGILAADMSLHSGDFHAAERTFELLTQAAGRAGRGDLPGEVVIQTYTPEHYSIVTAEKQDYEAFYRQEIAYRRMLSYPPVYHMLVILCTSEEETKAYEAAKTIMDHVERRLLEVYRKERVIPIGPADAAVAKVSDVYRKIVYLKAEQYQMLVTIKDEIEELMQENRQFSDVIVQFDFNPTSGF